MKHIINITLPILLSLMLFLTGSGIPVSMPEPVPEAEENVQAR